MPQEYEAGLGPAEDAGEMEGKYLTFWTDGQLFGIPIADVAQIVGMQAITGIPELPPYAKGVVNLRGSVIPLVDVRLRFGKPERAYNERTCIIIANIGGRGFGFIVDEVDEVTDIADDVISPPPRFSEGDAAIRYLSGVARHGQKLVLLIDASRMLEKEEFELLSDAAQ